MQLGELVAAGFGGFLAFLDAALHGLQVFELQLGVNDLFVTHRVHASVHMHHVLVVEAAQHMDDRVRLADVSQELVSQSFALAGSLDQTGYIDDLHGGRNDSALGVT